MKQHTTIVLLLIFPILYFISCDLERPDSEWGKEAVATDVETAGIAVDADGNPVFIYWKKDSPSSNLTLVKKNEGAWTSNQIEFQAGGCDIVGEINAFYAKKIDRIFAEVSIVEENEEPDKLNELKEESKPLFKSTPDPRFDICKKVLLEIDSNNLIVVHEETLNKESKGVYVSDEGNPSLFFIYYGERPERWAYCIKSEDSWSCRTILETNVRGFWDGWIIPQIIESGKVVVVLPGKFENGKAHYILAEQNKHDWRTHRLFTCETHREEELEYKDCLFSLATARLNDYDTMICSYEESPVSFFCEIICQDEYVLCGSYFDLNDKWISALLFDPKDTNKILFLYESDNLKTSEVCFSQLFLNGRQCYTPPFPIYKSEGEKKVLRFAGRFTDKDGGLHFAVVNKSGELIYFKPK